MFLCILAGWRRRTGAFCVVEVVAHQLRPFLYFLTCFLSYITYIFEQCRSFEGIRGVSTLPGPCAPSQGQPSHPPLVPALERRAQPYVSPTVVHHSDSSQRALSLCLLLCSLALCVRSQQFFVAAGVDHTCVLTTSSTVRCFGSNAYGQLGDGLAEAFQPGFGLTDLMVSRFVTLSSVVAVTAGAYHSCALQSTGVGGAVYCWGRNDFGQLGE